MPYAEVPWENPSVRLVFGIKDGETIAPSASDWMNAAVGAGCLEDGECKVLP